MKQNSKPIMKKSKKPTKLSRDQSKLLAEIEQLKTKRRQLYVSIAKAESILSKREAEKNDFDRQWFKEANQKREEIKVLSGKLNVIKKEHADWVVPVRTFGFEPDLHQLMTSKIQTWQLRLSYQDRRIESILMSPVTMMKCGRDPARPQGVTLSGGDRVPLVPCEAVQEGQAIFVGQKIMSGY